MAEADPLIYLTMDDREWTLCAPAASEFRQAMMKVMEGLGEA